MGKIHQIANQNFGYVTAIKIVGNNSGGYCIWECICECGNKTNKISSQLNKSNVSCGCKKVHPMLTHGKSKTDEYAIYKGIFSRCYNPNREKYKRYGGRGIKICDRWLHSFDNFLEDMGIRPSKKHSIERRNNDGDYEPSNCFWGTVKTQARNKSNIKLTMDKADEIRASKLSKKELAKEYNVTETTIFYVKNNKQWVK